ncbi:rapid alkalinization factor 23-like [Selaginella moellendorffii]|uniref:rapid alkalinization factor 23-like n=1 Tax=Selaginella moellendorffii TaxID=88036 RepID=UPI000D1C921D|nr:rapid alkalinization factor 23-like [Selaginella moellendorffii]|eukprot:XP_024544312.1 rapid alkalinization factor 23-like [Selaginella moellendorffii]
MASSIISKHWRLCLLAVVCALLAVRTSSSQGLGSGGSVGGGGGIDEFLLDTEIHGRFLASRQTYISYGSLTADRVPCPPMSGNSYYNPRCNRGGAANPYKRGCSIIAHCRREPN